jgi:hypothetical protein
VSVDTTTYEDSTNLSSTEFSVVIKNYTESDLNINYACSCGFTTTVANHSWFLIIDITTAITFDDGSVIAETI